MTLEKKIIITNEGQKELRIVTLDWSGNRCALEVDREIVATGSEDFIRNRYDRNLIDKY